VVLVSARDRLANVLAIKLIQLAERRSGVVLGVRISGAALQDPLEQLRFDEGINSARPGEKDEGFRVVETGTQSPEFAYPILRRADRLDHSNVGTVGIVATSVDQQTFLEPTESDDDDIRLAQGAQRFFQIESLVSHIASIRSACSHLAGALSSSGEYDRRRNFQSMKRSPSAVRPHRSAEQADAFRTLFRQQGDRLWNADRDVDWEAGSTIPESRRAAWLRMMNVFLGLEVMGLDTIQVMMSQATHQVRDPALNLYLAAQCQDEARHVYVLDRYLTEVNGHGYSSKPEAVLIERCGGMASWGFYSVENWLTSTLFSENFAALFLQQALELDGVDPLAKQIFRLILRDEVRHVNFLHTILPRLIDRLPAAGRVYVWQSQILLAGAVALGLRRIKADVAALGIDVDGYKATLIENLGTQFEDAGLDSFLKIETYARVINAAT